MKEQSKRIRDKLTARGWEFVGVAKNGHLKFRYPPNGRTFQVSSTPGDHRSSLNDLSMAKRLERL